MAGERRFFRLNLRNRAGRQLAGIAAITLSLLGLATARLWQDGLAFAYAPDQQETLKAGDGIVPASLRQKINYALAKQDYAAASAAMADLRGLYPNDVHIGLRDLEIRIGLLRGQHQLNADKRADLAGEIRHLMVRAGNDQLLQQRAQTLLAELIIAGHSGQ
ncbi:hypothetical protein [Thalassospira marina]|uniref:Periplasmic heavy metal sensor n=1 Tax=Thalassospira marina TaxID=2048283 RepID=A0ABN5FBC3_9PROT|nr:hypothetical protein [Thalassospira marina]AUG52062.1 hypothetical protein CSC3H3_04480 [Thalassospira marina]